MTKQESVKDLILQQHNKTRLRKESNFTTT